jgi:hypothetical protein
MNHDSHGTRNQSPRQVEEADEDHGTAKPRSHRRQPLMSSQRAGSPTRAGREVGEKKCYFSLFFARARSSSALRCSFRIAESLELLVATHSVRSGQIKHPPTRFWRPMKCSALL